MKVTLVIGFLFYFLGAPALDGWRSGFGGTAAPEMHNDTNQGVIDFAMTVRHFIAAGQHHLMASL